MKTDGTASVRDYAQASGATAVVIPEEANGYPVTAIEEEVFYQYRALKSVTLPSTLRSIGNAAFAYCEQLESITFPQGLMTIGRQAFTGCKKLSSPTFPDTVTAIGGFAFSYCNTFTSITLPPLLEIVEIESFGYCGALTSVTLSDGLKEIDADAFIGCKALKNIHIPASVEWVQSGAFAFCDSLKTITVAPDNDWYCVVDGVLYSKDMTKLVQFPLGSSMTSLTIPDGVTSIARGAFYGNHSLRDLTIPDSVTVIDNETIYNTGLTVYAPYFSAADMYTYQNNILFEPTGISTKADGDVNEDGKVTILDAVKLYYHVNGKNMLWGSALAHGNVCEPSALITIADAVAIYYIVNGQIIVG